MVNIRLWFLLLLTYILAFLLGMYIGAPKAVELEFGLGGASFSRSDDGVWWQSAHPHSIDLTSVSGSIGLRGDIGKGFGWRGGYAYLGNASFTSLATERDEDAHRHDVPLQSLSGSGSVQGLYGGLTWTRKWFQVEGGFYWYQPSWSVHAVNGSREADLSYKGGMHVSPYFGIGAGPVHLLYYPNIKASGDDTPAIYDGPAVQVLVRLCMWRKLRAC